MREAQDSTIGNERRTHAAGAKAARKDGNARRNLRYLPAVDGLRAFAVLAVIFYHMKLSWAPGGLMGVTVFFVISGYLISGLLVSEHDRTGRISLKQFWLRRVRRIIPAVLVAVAGTVVMCALANPVLLDKARPDIVPSLLFYNNWWQIFRDMSYFQAAGAPSPLTHYWSLAIEEQFYIVWPLLLTWLLRRKLPNRALAGVIAALAAVSAVEMALLFDPQGDPSRVYYGTDTRAMSLLVGAFLAIVWPAAGFGSTRGFGRRRARLRPVGSGKVLVRADLGAQMPTRSKRSDAEKGTTGDVKGKGAPRGLRALDVAGLASLAGLVAIVLFTSGFDSFPYLGGIALTSALSAVLVAAAADSGTLTARLLGTAPLAWVGKRSYGMYLWHYPILLITSAPGLPAETPWWARFVQLTVIVVVADLSFRFVEDPIRKGALGKWARERKDAARSKAGKAGVDASAGSGIPANADASLKGSALSDAASRTSASALKRRSTLALRRWVVTACVAALFVGAGCALAFTGPANGGQPVNTAVSVAQAKVIPRAKSAVAAEERRLAAERAAEEQRQREEAAKSAFDKEFKTEHLNAKGLTLYDPLLIGDSVAAGAVDEFYQAFPYGCIDAVVNRSIWESPYATYAQADQVGNYVVFCLGTNNAVTNDQVDEMISAVPSNKKIIIVNTRSPRDWVYSTNQALGDASRRHKNVVALIDWYSEAEGHPEYFWDDAIHLRPEGAKAYIDLVKKALQESVAPE